MENPFKRRAVNLGGPSQDILPIVPDDIVELPQVAVALYVETGGTIAIVTVSGEQRTLAMGDFSILPVGVRQIRATGTTALGIHAFMVS